MIKNSNLNIELSWSNVLVPSSPDILLAIDIFLVKITYHDAIYLNFLIYYILTLNKKHAFENLSFLKPKLDPKT